MRRFINARGPRFFQFPFSVSPFRMHVREHRFHYTNIHIKSPTKNHLLEAIEGNDMGQKSVLGLMEGQINGICFLALPILTVHDISNDCRFQSVFVLSFLIEKSESARVKIFFSC